MFNKSFALLVILALVIPASAASVTVRDWQFNTPGDTEGWTGQTYTVNNLHIGTAVGGTESVLTCENLQNQNDTKIYFPNETISLPALATSWDTLTYRIRQINDAGTGPKAFDTSGTIAFLANEALPTVAPIPTSTDLGAAVPVTVTAQADEWLLITWDISAYSADFNPLTRVDPITGTDVGGGVILGNFEIDYVTLTAVSPVPEPMTLGLLGFGAAAMLKRKRR